MKKIIFLLILFYGLFELAKTSSADTLMAASNSLADVQTAVASASAGDMVVVPAGDGTVTWDTYLNVTKPITLQGPGASSLTITTNRVAYCSNTGTTCSSLGRTYPDYAYYPNYFIYYTTGTASHANYLFRVTGFTFDTNNKSGVIYNNNLISDNNYSTPVNVRIDHNTIHNNIYTLRTYFETVFNAGPVYGVFDNNTNHGPFDLNIGYRGGYTWKTLTSEPGSSKAFFAEDNIFYIDEIDTTDGANSGSGALETGAGASNVFRFNTIYKQLQKGIAGSSTMVGTQNHGNNQNNVWAGQRHESYGNLINDSYDNRIYLFNSRGGWNLVFNNRIQASAAVIDVKEYETYSGLLSGQSAYDGWLDSNIICPDDGEHLYPGTESCGIAMTHAGETNYPPQHVWRNYFFNNRSGKTGAGDRVWVSNPYYNSTPLPSIAPVVDTHYFADNTMDYPNNLPSNSSFCEAGADACTKSIGCGTLANRPASCTKGVGYWVPNATIDATASSCNNLDTFVGANNTLAASVSGNIGTLYRCSATNAWTAYYTPYAYPHPLRQDSNTAPAAPQGLSVQ